MTPEERMALALERIADALDFHNNRLIEEISSYLDPDQIRSIVADVETKLADIALPSEDKITQALTIIQSKKPNQENLDL